MCLCVCGPLGLHGFLLVFVFLLLVGAHPEAMVCLLYLQTQFNLRDVLQGLALHAFRIGFRILQHIVASRPVG